MLNSWLVLAILLYFARAESSKFLLGMPFNVNKWHTTAGLTVTTTANENVRYTVSVNDVLLGHGFVNATASAEVIIPESYIITDSSFNNRHKGIIIETSGNANVRGYNSFIDSSKGASTAVFNILPCTDFSLNEYKYYAVSSQSKYSSLLLLVGYDDDTTIKIKPTIDIQIPQNPQSVSSPVITVDSGSIHTVTLHRGQTLLLAVPGEDLSGTQVASNKPLSVISGHECIQIPSNKGGCDQVLTQIPPSVMWGKEYLLVPAAGRNSGQMIKIQSSVDNTTIKHNCINDATTEVTLENVYEMQTSSRKACHLQSDQPILVAQFTLGQETDGLGDPSLMIIPPVEQYVQETSFTILPTNLTFPNQFLTIIAISTAEFEPALVYLDDEHVQCEWSMIYNFNFSNILGYACHFSSQLLPNPSASHVISHKNPNGHLALLMHGFNGDTTLRQGFAYNAGGLAMIPINAIAKVEFLSSNYKFDESDKFAVVDIWRKECNEELHTLVTAVNISAVSGHDFESFEKVITFLTGETTKTIKIPLVDDEIYENPEEFIIRIQPLTNYSHTSKAMITIEDNDMINIGFVSPTKVGNTIDNRIQVGTLSGQLQDDIALRLKLTLEYLSTDKQGNTTSLTEMVDISSNETSKLFSPVCCDDMGSLTVVAILSLQDNSNHVMLKPSIILLPSHPSTTNINQPSNLPQQISRMPSITPSNQPSVVVSYPNLMAVDDSLSNILLAVFVSSICTAVVTTVLGIIGCFLAYRCGKSVPTRYQVFKRQSTLDDNQLNESYVVHSVSF